jgi:hypothetical protein
MQDQSTLVAAGPESAQATHPPKGSPARGQLGQKDLAVIAASPCALARHRERLRQRLGALEAAVCAADVIGAAA